MEKIKYGGVSMGSYFGTDGVRGLANQKLTPELAFDLGKIGGYLLTKGKDNKKITVGKDTRLSCDMLEAALMSGMMSVGIEVIKLGIIPTPGVAYITRKINACAGVMISASHNSFEDNGIKFFDEGGFKISSSLEEEIEYHLEKGIEIERPVGDKIGMLTENYESVNQYIQFLKQTTNQTFSDMKIVVDCANGATTPIVKSLFADLEFDIKLIGVNPNGTNINEDCGSTKPKKLQEAVLEEKADLGIAFDGDGDRLIAIDNEGNVIDGDAILYICGKHLKEEGNLRYDTVVSTVMSNFGLSKGFNEIGIELKRTSVGDKYVMQQMKENGFVLGGEQSGHIIFLNHNTTGDGIIASLQLLNVIKEKGKTLKELSQEYKVYPQSLINVKVKDKYSWENNELIKKSIRDMENLLEGKGRVLIRPSGTESLVRVMTESRDKEETERIAIELANIIKEEDDKKKA